MSDTVKLIIEIPRNEYEYTCERTLSDRTFWDDAIRKGTPLPKGHGRLIILSEDAIKRELTPLGVSCQYWISEVGLSNATVAIIEADKAESEET